MTTGASTSIMATEGKWLVAIDDDRDLDVREIRVKDTESGAYIFEGTIASMAGVLRRGQKGSIWWDTTDLKDLMSRYANWVLQNGPSTGTDMADAEAWLRQEGLI